MEDLVHRAELQRCFSSTHNKSKPGEFILSLGIVKRQMLKELKSEDMDNVRPDSFYNP